MLRWPVGRSGIPDKSSQQRIGEFPTARILELKDVREGRGERRLKLLAHHFLGAVET